MVSPAVWQTRLAATLPWSTNDLTLRQVTRVDASILIQLYADSDVQRFVGTLFSSASDAHEIIEMRPDVFSSFYVVEQMANNTPIGCAAFIQNDLIGDTDMLIALFPQFRGNGYGHQILEKLTNVWINDLKNDHCTATVLPTNQAARKLLAHCRFRQTAEYTNKSLEKSLVYRFP